MKLSQDVKTAISAAVTASEKRTSAEIAVVVSPASDTYQAYLLVYGFAVGSVFCCQLYWAKILTVFPLLFVIQAVVMALFAFVPLFRTMCLKLLPPKILHDHAARRASQEFQHLSKQVPADRPVLLLYVSLEEKYAHILHSRAIAQKIPAGIWDKIIADFTSTIKSSGLKEACLSAISKSAAALEPVFPDRGEGNTLGDDVVEKR